MPLWIADQRTGRDMVPRPGTTVRRALLPALRVCARLQETTHHRPGAMQEHQKRLPESNLRQSGADAGTVLQNMHGSNLK